MEITAQLPLRDLVCERWSDQVFGGECTLTRDWLRGPQTHQAAGPPES